MYPVLIHAREKIQSAIDQVRELLAVEFPHPDSQEALRIILKLLEDTRIELHTIDGYNKAIVNAACMRAIGQLSLTLEVLGRIINSANIRNAFETHYPLLQLSKQFLNDNTKLILSFEWDYVPFTYPQNIDELPDFVVIALPASESTNTLIIPAAGHELGHSAWRHSFLKNYEERVEDCIWDILLHEAFTNTLQRITSTLPIEARKQFGRGDLLSKILLIDAFEWALSQCEELFCDFVGMQIFGSAFPKAFAYLLAPRLAKERAPDYPSLKSRSEYMSRFAKKSQIEMPENYSSIFQAEDEPFRPERFRYLMLKLADAAVEHLSEALMDTAIECCTSKGFSPPTHTQCESIRKALLSHVPSDNPISLAHVIVAGWDVYENPEFLNDKKMKLHSRRISLLNEIMLKSIEVIELKSLLGDRNA